MNPDLSHCGATQAQKPAMGFKLLWAIFIPASPQRTVLKAWRHPKSRCSNSSHNDYSEINVIRALKTATSAEIFLVFHEQLLCVLTLRCLLESIPLCTEK